MDKRSMTDTEAVETTPANQATTWPRFRWTRIWQARNFSLIVLFMITLVISALLSPFFLTRQNIESGLVNFFVEMAIVTIGQALVILIRGIDLSVGGVVALSAVGVGFLFSHGVNIWIATICGLIIGAGCGLLNGFLVTRMRTPPLIATLGSGILYTGITYGITGGRPYSNFPQAYQNLGQGGIGPFPTQIVILVLISVLVHVAMTNTRYGRWVYAIGGNETAAHFSGIPVERVRLAIYTASGFFAAIGGIVMSARFLSAGPLLATGVELETITAALLGGISIAGGQGSVAGALLGMLVIATLGNGLTLAGVSNSTLRMIIAVLLLLIISTETILGRKRLA